MTYSVHFIEDQWSRINDIISEQDKLSRLKDLKGFAKVAVLFHLSGVASSVATNPYFYRIVDIVDFFETEK